MRVGNRMPTVWLGCLACALVPIYAFYAFIYTQTPTRLAQHSARLIETTRLWSFIVSLNLPVPQNDRSVAVTLAVSAAAGFMIYALAISLGWNQSDNKSALAIAVGAALLFFGIAAFALPNYNTDIFNYVANGRLAAVHHRNPYEVAPDAFRNDPVYSYAGHQYTGTPGDNKLGAWMITDIFLAKIAGDGVVKSLFVYRAFFVLLNALNLMLLLRIAKRLRPDKRLAAVVVYGWNPIVATAGQGKVDTLMVLFLLLALLWLARRRITVGAVCLTLSVLVKLITLPLLVILWLKQAVARRWQDLSRITLSVVLTTTVIYLPFLGADGLVGREVRLLNSEGSATTGRLHTFLSIVFVALVVILAAKIQDDIGGFITGWALAALYFSMFLTVIGYSWYLIAMIAVVAVAADARVVVPAVLICCPMFLVNTWQSALTEPFPLRGTRYLAVVSSIALVGAFVASRIVGRESATTDPRKSV
jgi:hypothetical protein